jgi:hypothetical protein
MPWDTTPSSHIRPPLTIDTNGRGLGGSEAGMESVLASFVDGRRSSQHEDQCLEVDPSRCQQSILHVYGALGRPRLVPLAGTRYHAMQKEDLELVVYGSTTPPPKPRRLQKLCISSHFHMP